MGLKNTIDAANRYGENQNILYRVVNDEIESGSPEDEKQFDYFIRSDDSLDDIKTILNTVKKSLTANGQKVNAENLDKFFKSLIRIYMSQNNTTDKPEPEDNGSEPATDEEIRKMQEQAPLIFGKPEDDEHFGEEQAEGLDNLLEGLRDTPHDNRW